MIDRRHPLSPAKSVLVGLPIALALWAALLTVVEFDGLARLAALVRPLDIPPMHLEAR